MTTQSSQDEIKQLIRQGPNSKGYPVLDWPDLDQVQAAIEAWPEGEVELRLLDEKEYFSSASPYSDHAIVRRRVVFKRITLTHIKDLEVDSRGAFSYGGEVREYYDNWHEHGGNIVRSYSTGDYKITYDPDLNVRCVYKRNGGGQGTELEGEN